jgi:hypothetical protein
MKTSPSMVSMLAALGLLGAAAVQADTLIYNVTLSGANESPPVASFGTGFGIVTLDTTSFTMRVQSIFAGLTGITTVAHIHCCTMVPEAGTAGVATTTPTFPGFPVGVTSGTYDVTFNMLDTASWNAAYITNNGGTVNSAFSALAAGMAGGSAYLNIHTNFAPGGEIRGFLVAQIPEPSTYALMALGLAAVGGLARRRRLPAA